MKFPKGSTKRARELTLAWIGRNFPGNSDFLNLGLPEYDDRLGAWRVPLNTKNSKLTLVGEIKIDAALNYIIEHTNIELIQERITKYKKHITKIDSVSKKPRLFYPTPIPNKVILGDCIKILEDFPPDTAQLVFTSPPYYNAKPEYSEYVDYPEYLDFLRRAFARCHAILSEGRFFVVNISPILIKRLSRNQSSKRIALPFDLHRILDSIGFDFIDDIIWVKPEGAGWNLGRGRRFRADRQPLQYKPVTVTEYVLVYRKKTDRLIDWNIRNHYNRQLVRDSKIIGDYDVTNVWKIHPSSNKSHPATFPEELVRKVIRYYSFKGDLVLDPFAGSGTVGKVAYEMKRRFLLCDNESKYFKYMKESLGKIIGPDTRVDYVINE
jgi:DNA modification methylase